MKVLKLWPNLLILSFINCACSTSSFVVKSDPLQADVYVQLPSGEKKPLGKTPLQMPMPEIKKVVGPGVLAGEFFTIEVEKAGYLPQTFNVPATHFGTMLTALDVKMKPGTAAKESRVAKDILDHLYVAQKFALQQQFERAQIELDKILKDFPDFARALSMRASIYYAQKNLGESLKWYEEALKSDPQMESAIQMAAKVRQLQERVPASTGSIK